MERKFSYKENSKKNLIRKSTKLLMKPQQLLLPKKNGDLCMAYHDGNNCILKHTNRDASLLYDA